MRTDIFKLNRWDYLIIFYLALMALGQIGGAAQPIRLFVVAWFPWLINQNSTIRGEREVKSIKSFFVLWYLYILISLGWTLDPSQGMKEVIYFPIHMAGFLLLFSFSKKANSPLKSITLGWVLMIAATIPIALRELIYDVHLSISAQDSDRLHNFGGGDIIQWKFASATFGNYNSYNTVIAMAFPFMLYSLKFIKSKTLMAFAIATSLFGAYTVFTNASRGASAAIAIISFFVITANWKSLKQHKIFIFLFAVPFLYFLISNASTILGQLIMRLSSNEFFEDTARTQLILVGFKSIFDTLGFGFGAGCMLLANAQYLGYTFPSHNAILEIAIQYGLLIAMCVVLWIFKIFRFAYRTKDILFKPLAYACIISLPFTLTVDSSYVLNIHIWLYFSSLFCFYYFTKYDTRQYY